jgi:uncharacterized repeat protein (TIGR01451 family)
VAVPVASVPVPVANVRAAVTKPRPVRTPALAIDKSTAAQATAGQLVNYSITVRNTGRATANRVVLRDAVPAQFSVTNRVKGARLSNGTLTWNLGNLRPGASKTVTFRLRLDSAASGTRCNTASAKGSNTSRVSDRACTKVTAVAARVEPAVTG